MTILEATIPALQISIILTVFGFGLEATVQEVLYVLRRPRLLLRSLLAMYVIMPILAVLLAEAFEFRRSVEIALVALAISPIPPLLPAREQMAGGRRSFGLGLMAIAGVLSIVVVPIAARLLGRYLGEPFVVPTAVIARIVLVAAILPLAAGLIVRAVYPAVADRILRPVTLVAKTALTASIIALLIGLLPASLALIGNGTVLVLAVFVLAGLAVGHWLGGPNADERPVLALSTATRHPAIALAIARVGAPDQRDLGATIFLSLLVAAIICVPYLMRQRKAVAASRPG